MNVVRAAYLGILAAALALSVLSAGLFVALVQEEDRGGSWFWAGAFVVSSLAAAWSFWELLEGSA